MQAPDRSNATNKYVCVYVNAMAFYPTGLPKHAHARAVGDNFMQLQNPPAKAREGILIADQCHVFVSTFPRLENGLQNVTFERRSKPGQKKT